MLSINRFLLTTTALLISCVINVSHAQSAIWKDVSVSETANRSTTAQPGLKLLPDKYRLLQVDLTALKQSLNTEKVSSKKADTATTNTDADKNHYSSLTVPLPNNENVQLVVKKNSVMATELAVQFPQIQTWRVDAKDNKGIYGVIDLTEEGFHAMLFLPDNTRLFIDPRQSGNKKLYISYLDKNYHPADKPAHHCLLDGTPHQHNDTLLNTLPYMARKIASRTGNNLRTYRLAMAATGEYTAYHGGTVAGALSAIVTTVNRVNAIYERDLAIHLELVGNNHLLIHTDTTTYSNNDASAMLLQNQAEIDRVIGSANYDIGHVVSTGGGGVAYLGSTCSNNKAGGVTGSPVPETDAFDIDFVAHEIGHQLGANHTFNSETGSCSGNRNSATAVEPGSGSTIMAYAGICGANDLQPHSDAMFHIFSIAQIGSFIDNTAAGGSCGVQTALANQQPVAQAGADFTIPANTAFELKGNGTDPDGDTLTYSWEEIDAGAPSDVNVVLNDNAIFRTFLPQSTSLRSFPQLSTLLGNSTNKGETLPDLARQLNFSLVVRDQQGGVNADEMKVTVVDSTGFKITSHQTPTPLRASTQTELTWDVANTNSAPVNCSAVNILLTTDQGNSYIDVLGSSTANDGSEMVTIPAEVASSTTARFKLKCANNIFFDISDADLVTVPLLDAGTPVLGNLGDNQVADPGESITMLVPLINKADIEASSISAQLLSNQSGVVSRATSSYPDIQPNTTENNTSAYQLSVPSSLTCGANLPLSLNTSFSLGTTSHNKVFTINVPTGKPESASATVAPAISIPDNDANGINSVITLTGVSINSNPAINVTLDISHFYRGDLKITLTSPQGTTIRLKEVTTDPASDIAGNYPAQFAPVDSLDTFNGEDLNGDWTLNIADVVGGDTGTLNSWSLGYTRYICDTTQLPETDPTTNAIPVASDLAINTNEAIPVMGTLPAIDNNNDVLSFTIVNNARLGTATITNPATGSFTYTPFAGESGEDTFTYKVNDGNADSNIATVTVTINKASSNTQVSGNNIGNSNAQSGGGGGTTSWHLLLVVLLINYLFRIYRLVLQPRYIDGYRVIQSVQDKACVADNGCSLVKTHNAVLDALDCSRRASQKVVSKKPVANYP